MPVILILMLDQAIFTITDTAMGIVADRIASLIGRLGVFAAALTALSCAAFAALPFVAGAGAKVPLIVLIVIWAITSSALRAPPLTLLGKYCARPQLPYLAALVMLGYGIAGAISPYLGVVLRDVDPRLPFVISSVVLLLTTLALSRVERDVARGASAKKPPKPAKPFGTVPVLFVAAMILLSLGYQLHFSINSAPFYLRFAKPTDLQWLMPVFWIGFNIAMFPASAVVKHRGALIVMGAAGLLGAAAVLVAEMAGKPQHADRRAVRCRRGLGLHADERGFGRACHRPYRRGGQGDGPGVFRAGARDLCADGGGRGRATEAAGICAAVALGADRLLVGRRLRASGDCRGAGAAEHASPPGSLILRSGVFAASRRMGHGPRTIDSRRRRKGASSP